MRLIAAFIVALSCIHAYGQTMQMNVVRGRVVVSGEIGGAQRGTFILDSALPVPVIDTAAATRFGIVLDENGALDMPGPDGQFVRAVPGALPPVRIGGVGLGVDECVAMPLKPVAERLGVPVDGLIDFTHLGPVIRFDFERGLLSVSRASQAQANGALIRRGIDGSWFVGIVVDDAVAIEAVIDFSYGGTLSIPEEFAENRGLIQGDTRLLNTGEGASTMRLRRLRLGNAIIESPLCELMSTGAHPRIGMGFLKRWSFAIDTYASQLLMETNDVALTDPPLVGLGMALVRATTGGWEVAVAEGAPAARAGVATGDRLTSINGEFIGGRSFDEVAQLLAVNEGQAVECRMERAENASVYKVRLVAQQLL